MHIIVVHFNCDQCHFLIIQQSKLQKSISPATTPTKASYQSPKLHFQGGNPYPPFSLKKSAQDWELHPCQIIVEDKIGQGGFGDIYEGTIRGGIGLYKCNGPQIMRVAVKILRGEYILVIEHEHGWWGTHIISLHHLL